MRLGLVFHKFKATIYFCLKIIESYYSWNFLDTECLNLIVFKKSLYLGKSGKSKNKTS